MLMQEMPRAEFTGEEEAAAERLAASLRRPGRWGWKEPRTCLFLPLWQRVLKSGIQPVVVYRHPIDVHASFMRRDHWDLALFPDQVHRAYAVYNNAILSSIDKSAVIFNASSAFNDVDGLVAMLSKRLGLTAQTSLPEFHRGEFQQSRISRAVHHLFAQLMPEAARAFDALEAGSALPFPFVEREDDEEIKALSMQLGPIWEKMPPSIRAAFVPMFDWIVAGKTDSSASVYADMASEIGKMVQRVEGWNREAAAIFEQNTKLSKELERMGGLYRDQQAFLKEQKETNAKMWKELSRTGKSWNEQRDLIESLIGEKKALTEELANLRTAKTGKKS